LRDLKGQGSAEYLLLLGGVIIFAIVAINLYYSYFNVNSNNNETVDVNINITSIGSPYALKAVYEVNDTTNGNKVISGGSKSFFYLNPGNKKSINLGKMKSGTSFTVLVGVGNPDVAPQDLPGSDWTGKNRWVMVSVSIGDKVTSWQVAGPYNWHNNPSGASIRSFTIPGKGGTNLNYTEDASKVRLSILAILFINNPGINY
jgi:uncharacterized protein (UPF0333 family)